jgi:hypothetical protein
MRGEREGPVRFHLLKEPRGEQSGSTTTSIFAGTRNRRPSRTS